MILEVYVDGGSRGNPGPAACAIYIPKRKQAFGNYLGIATNNQAEYRGLLLALSYGMQDAAGVGVKGIRVYSDSQLMVRQMKGEYQVRNPSLLRLFQVAESLSDWYHVFEIIHIPREENTEADAEVNRILDAEKP